MLLHHAWIDPTAAYNEATTPPEQVPDDVIPHAAVVDPGVVQQIPHAAGLPPDDRAAAAVPRGPYYCFGKC